MDSHLKDSKAWGPFPVKNQARVMKLSGRGSFCCTVAPEDKPRDGVGLLLLSVA